jgi:hypothetical protein
LKIATQIITNNNNTTENIQTHTRTTTTTTTSDPNNSSGTTEATRKNHDGRRETHVQRETHAGQNDGDHQMWSVGCDWDCIEAVRSCDGIDVTTKPETKRICSNKPPTEISQNEGDH